MSKTSINKLPIAIISAILLGVILPMTVQGNSDKKTTTVSGDSLSYNDRRRYDYFFLEAICKQNEGKYDAAFELLNHCLEINPKAAEAYYARASYFSEMQMDSLALKDIEKAAALNPDNDTYQERVAQYYINAGNYDNAITAYENLYEHHKDRSDVLAILLQLYNHNRDYKNMLGTIGRMEQVEGNSDELTLAKMNVYEMKGDTKMAEKMLQSLTEAHPSDAVYKVMYGNWLLQKGKKEEAHKMLTAALEDDPDNESAQSSMYDYYRSTGQDSLATITRDKLLLNQKTSSKTKLAMFNQLIKESEDAGGDSTAILQMFNKVIATDKSDTDIPTLKAAYMELKKMPEDSVNNAFKYVLNVAPENTYAVKKLIESYWNKQRWDDIINLCKQSVLYNPEDMTLYYFLGLAHFQKDEEDEALDAFKRGVGEINNESDPNIVSDFYAIMGDILYKKGKPEEAFAAYDSCLQWKEDNISCLNNYAYYLSELDRDLDKAEQMSYKTVTAEPNNATYLDTYAWILFMKGRYSEAKSYIDQALSVESDSTIGPVVIEHAGDIYAMNGDTSKAVEYWEKALSMGGDKAILQKKIKQRKYIKKK